MNKPVKASVVTLISMVLFAFTAAPATATPQQEEYSFASATPASNANSQSLDVAVNSAETESLDQLLVSAEVKSTPHGFDVEAAIAQAESEVGTSRATGWSQPGECIISAKRWITAGGGNWTGSGNPVANYNGAQRLPAEFALPGDVIQYEHINSPLSWVSGVHTVLVTETNGDGTFTIIQSNWPGGSGLVTKEENWVPAPPSGFQAVAWRF